MLNSYRVKFCAVLASIFVLPLITFACGEGEYLVTAYYSPSPSQEYFLTGDYKSEMRLNGKGLFTASTMPVSDNKFAFVADSDDDVADESEEEEEEEEEDDSD